LAAKAHAKINPYLAVGARRKDGYHEIATVIQAIALHDLVTVSSAEATTVRCSNHALDGDDNLVSKALRLCREIADVPPLDIHIDKRIPLEAGLGGGSSDTGTALFLINKFAGGVLDTSLQSIALACGSDVPFFVLRHARAEATGRGENLKRLPILQPSKVVIAKPAVGSSTAEAYRRLDECGVKTGDIPEAHFNDFEKVAPVESLALIDLIAALGASPVGLCGSGSAVFGYADNADSISAHLAEKGYWTCSTETISEFSEPWTP
jgi:4-diphosphocytidyl-2-C-methyl-D-erythritol kinase